MEFEDPQNYKAFIFQMGVGAARDNPTNHVAWIECAGGQLATAQSQPARGDWFNDGRVHRLGARKLDGTWMLTMDGIDQLSVPETAGKPLGIVTQGASVAVYGVSRSSHPLQYDARSLDIRASDAERR